MAKWYYIDESGEQRCVSNRQLKWLAKQGKITPQTMLENESGRIVPARKVQGLTFTEHPETELPESDPFLTPLPLPPPLPKTLADPPHEDTLYEFVGSASLDPSPASPETVLQTNEPVTQEMITTTEPEGGHKENAGQIFCLKINADEPHIVHQSVPMAVRTHSQQATGSLHSWLCDFAFRDIRIHAINLWCCRVLYIIFWIPAFIVGLWLTFMLFLFATNHFSDNVPYALLAIVIGVPLIWLVVAIFLFIIRLSLEWSIVVFDWMTETTKAARIYVENNKKE